MAGIMHFANFFRMMEEAEHAFWRSMGFSVHPTEEPRTGWPRVHASCDFRKPLRFEDVVTVEVLVEEIRGKAVRFLHRFWLGEELCATGRITALNPVIIGTAFVAGRARVVTAPSSWLPLDPFRRRPRLAANSAECCNAAMGTPRDSALPDDFTAP